MPQTVVKRQKQVQATQDRFTDSLAQLLKTVPYKDITVNQICENAHLSRRTFSRHFDNTDQLLGLLVRRMSQRLFELIESDNPQNFQSILFNLFTVLSREKDFLRILHDNDKMYLVRDGLFYADRYNSDLINFARQSPELHIFAIGGIINLIDNWVEKDFNHTPREMSALGGKIAVGVQELL